MLLKQLNNESKNEENEKNVLKNFFLKNVLKLVL